MKGSRTLRVLMMLVAGAHASLAAGDPPAETAPPTPAGLPSGEPTDAQRGCSWGPVFKVGRKMVYRFTSVIEALPDEPDSGSAKVYTSSFTLRLTVLGVDDQGAASLAVLIDHVKLIANTDGTDVVAECTRQTAEAGTPLPETATPMDRLALALAGCTIRLDVRADGTVTEATGLAAPQAIAQLQGVDGRRLLGPLDAGAEKRTLAMLFRADTPDAPAGEPVAFKERKVGDTWALADRIPLPDGSSLLLTTSLTLETCTEAQARATGMVRTSVEAPRGTDGRPLKTDPAQPTVEIEKQTDSLTMVWNTAAGVLKSRERESFLALAARLGGVKQTMQTLRTTSKVELIELLEE